MATSTWRNRELPILEAIAELTLNRPFVPVSSEIMEATGLDSDAVAVGLERLQEAGYVRTGSTLNKGGHRFPTIIGLLEPGLREVGVWPADDPYAALIARLDEMIADAEPEAKGRLTKLREGVVGVGRDVFVNVFSAVITTGRLPGQ